MEKPKEEVPVIYNCPACTLENPVSVTECAICGTPRPPMEVIIAEFRAAQEELKAVENGGAKPDGQEEAK